MSANQTQLTPLQAMELAISEAKRGLGRVSPNPPVGCTIIDKDFHLLSVGYHKACGEAHAEVDALNKIKDLERLKGAHVFVTLEPCAHQGRTPSCAKALAELPIASVSYAVTDPNPLVAGKGVAILQQAGKEVRLFDQLNAEIEELAEIFLHNMRSKMPFVALKVATSLDGQMALKNGESRWITAEPAREYGHFLRACYDATLVGAGTFLADNPALNIRHPEFKDKKNKVVLLDPAGQCLSHLRTSRVLQHNDPQNVVVIVAKDMDLAADHLPVKVIKLGLADGAFDVSEVLTALYDDDIRSVYIEGGSQVYASFLKANKVDRIYNFIAPVILGAKNGLSWTSFFGVHSIKEGRRLKQVQSTPIGDDLLVTGRLN